MKCVNIAYMLRDKVASDLYYNCGRYFESNFEKIWESLMLHNSRAFSRVTSGIIKELCISFKFRPHRGGRAYFME